MSGLCPQDTHLGALLQDNGTALEYDVEVVAGRALFDNRFAVLKGARLQGIGNGEPLPLVQALQYGDTRQELLVHLTLAYGWAHQDASVAVAIDAPQLHIGLGAHCGGTWCAIDESQLTEAAALADGGHQFRVHKDLKYMYNS